MKDNETIAKIRQTREEIARRVDFDPKRLIDFYKEKQKARASHNGAKPRR